ncbi:hypothetical protein AB0D74_42345 [Streptomyces sp. NPDC048278]
MDRSAGRREEKEADMTHLFASRTAVEIALDAVRSHGGHSG